MYLNEQYYLERSIRLKRIVEDLKPKFGFEHLSVEHKDLYMKYEPAARISSRCFLSLYAYTMEDEIVLWEDTELEYLCLLHLDREMRLCSYPPLGEYREDAYSRMIEKMRHMFALAKEPFHMDNIEENEVRYLEKLPGYRIYFSTTPDEDDYVYEIANLTNYEGAANTARRKNRNNFLNKHTVEVHVIGPDYWADCEKVMDTWCSMRDCSACGFRCPKSTALRTLRNLDKLSATGGIMYMDGEPEALMLVGLMSGEMGDSLSSFAINRYRGLTQCLLDETCKKCLPTFKYLNLEEDLGIPNLRQYKQSLNPDLMIKKYSAHLVTGLFM